MSYLFNDTAANPFEADEVELLTDEQFPYSLIVWNDNVNTFDWVIETLIEVCGHTPEQAEQCSLIIHFQGKCAVKNGVFPWYEGDLPLWWCPDLRFVLFPDELIVSKSMKKLLKKNAFAFTVNKAFEEVIHHCRHIKRQYQDGTWITGEVQKAYIKL